MVNPADIADTTGEEALEDTTGEEALEDTGYTTTRKKSSRRDPFDNRRV